MNNLALALPIIAVVMSGCSTYAVPRYSASAESVEKLRAQSPASAKVGAFAMQGTPRGEITCRGVGPIKTADGESFADYAKKALSAELRMAGLYSETSPTTLTGSLDRVDFSSTEGFWDIALTVTSTTGGKVSKEIRYPYATSFVGETACNQTAQAFMPAMQDLIGAAVGDPAFSGMLSRP